MEMSGVDASISVHRAHDASTELMLDGLYRSHYKKLHMFIAMRVRNPVDSHDLAGQAFLEACKGIRSFRGESELGTWLYGIAMNLIRAHVRRAPELRYEFLGDDALDDVCDTAEGPSERMECKESISRLQWHLNELPEELRSALLMVTLDELSYEEAASRLRIPIGTVRSRVWRSRMLLRQRLAGDGIQVPAGRAEADA